MAATSGLVGMTLVKGFNRLKGIDEARAKLMGLGHDAKSIEGIMDSALSSVKGTFYDMSEAATTAAGAVAAGIKPGKDLTRYLSLTADAAAISGSSMSEMGSIFNKVQTSQKAYTEELEMLADRGVPIYQWIADEAGVAQGAVKELASDGKISSELFLKAIEENIGGAAKIMGESSFTAAIANIGASISRIGANFLDAGESGGGFFSQVKPLLAELNEELGKVEEKAADLGVKFGETFTKAVNKLKEFKARFDELPPAVQKAGAAGAVFAVGLGPGLEVVGKGLENISAVSGSVGKFFSGIKGSISGIPGNLKTMGKGFVDVIGDFKNLSSGIVQPFIDAGKAIANTKLSKKVAAIVGDYKTKISEFASVKWDSIKTKISNSTRGITMLFSSFSENISAKLSPLKEKISSILSSVSGKLGEYGSKIGGSLSSLLGKVGSFAPTFAKGMSIAAGIGVLVAGMGLLQKNFGSQINAFLSKLREDVSEDGPKVIENFLSGIASALPNLITGGSLLISTLLNTITALLPTIVSNGMSIVSALISGLAHNLPSLIPAALKMIITLVTGLINSLPELINSGIQLLEGLVGGIVAALPFLVNAIPDIISSFVITIGKNLPKIIETGINLLVMLINGILDAIPRLISALPQIISTIQEAFAKEDWATIGKNLLNSIIDGIRSILSNLWSTIKEITSGIAKMFTFNVSSDGEVKSGSIPQNARGTDYWSGGLTYMNEGGRGELVSLPSGSQIIPHDISVKYAKEAARSNTAAGGADVSALGDYIVTAVVDTSRLYAEKMAKGISGMRMTVNNREAGRFMSDLGFVRR